MATLRKKPPPAQEQSALHYYLTTMVKMRERIGAKPPGFKWWCMEDFVLQMGRRWLWKAKPRKLAWMPRGQCFDNAYQLATRFSNLFYVEGFALSIIPVHHAWCIDKRTGLVVDPTWRKTSADTEYWGVPFFHSAVTIERDLGSCSVIDNWKARWPVLCKTEDELHRQLFVPYFNKEGAP